jgi:threonine synthase
MDIQVPYNYERLLYLCCQDHVKVAQIVNSVNEGNMVDLPPDIWVEGFSRLGLKSHSVKDTQSSSGDDEVLETIKGIFDEVGYVVDPHTAVGIKAARLVFNDQDDLSAQTKHHVLCMGCAHPAKFAETICIALGISVDAAVELLGNREPNHKHVKVVRHQ